MNTLTPPAPLALRVAGSLALLGLALTPSELKLKAADHKNLGKLVGDYYEAYEAEKGIQEKLAKLVEQIEATDKKTKTKALSLVEDWEEVFRVVTSDRLKGSLKLKKGEVASVKAKNPNGSEVAFAYSVPKVYPPKNGVLPLVLTVPDAGEDPAAHLNAQWNDPGLRESAILVAVTMGSDTTAWGKFGSPESPGGVFPVMNTLGVVRREFAVDFNRTFVAGAGQGFAAAETTASVFPHCFAGLIGLGNVAASDDEHYTNFRSLPTLLVKGGDGATAIKAKIDELNYANCELAPEGGVAEVAAWIGKTVRHAYPLQFEFVPTSDYSKRAHWISISGFTATEHPRIDAKADRATNTVTITAQKLTDVTIYLNDVLVDLDKPVKFVINGTTQEQTVARSAEKMIKNQFNEGDWGRLFTAYVSEPIP